MRAPRVSVIIPAYNAAEFIPATLASVFDQSFRDFEVVVVDDGSSDNTSPMVRRYAGNRVRLEQIAPSGGPARPRNVGIKASRGELIALFDSDDLMLPHKLEAAVQILEEFPSVDAVCTDFALIDEHGAPLKARFLDEYRSFRSALDPSSLPECHLLRPDRLYPELLRANFIGTSSVILRRRLFDQVGWFDESLANADDVDLWLRLARARKRLAYLDRVCHSYRRRHSSISAGGTRRFPSVLRALEKQRQYRLTDEEKKLLEYRIWKNQLSYAYWLRRTGRSIDACYLYRTVLRKRIDGDAVKGLLLSGLTGFLPLPNTIREFLIHGNKSGNGGGHHL